MRYAIAIACAFLTMMSVLPSPADSLYGQAMAKLLNRHFPEKNISYLLVDTPSGELLAARWPNREQPAPMGSLVKPFTALAYARSHNVRYPEFTCRGKAGGCWHPQGHGTLNMVQAIAHSCNAYFLQLAAQLQTDQVAAEATRFQIGSPPARSPSTTLIGLGADWKIEPLRMAQAYGKLAQQRTEPGAAPLLRGMALSTKEGTGHAVGQALEDANALVKTGTAPCVHGVEWSGDGYVLMLYPADSPRLTLLVRVHGAPGAEAAKTGAQMLRLVVRGDEK